MSGGTLFVPPELNPTSTVVKLGSYTIPASKYAVVQALVRNGGTFSIDGVVALHSSAQTITNIQSTTDFTVPAGAYFEGFGSSNGGGSINGHTIPVGVPFTLRFGPSTLVSIATATVSGIEISGKSSEATAQYLVPTGTLLNISGDARYTVMEFDQLS